jgi:hypothetical protein
LHLSADSVIDLGLKKFVKSNLGNDEQLQQVLGKVLDKLNDLFAQNRHICGRFHLFPFGSSANGLKGSQSDLDMVGLMPDAFPGHMIYLQTYENIIANDLKGFHSAYESLDLQSKALQILKFIIEILIEMFQNLSKRQINSEDFDKNLRNQLLRNHKPYRTVKEFQQAIKRGCSTLLKGSTVDSNTSTEPLSVQLQFYYAKILLNEYSLLQTKESLDSTLLDVITKCRHDHESNDRYYIANKSGKNTLYR